MRARVIVAFLALTTILVMVAAGTFAAAPVASVALEKPPPQSPTEIQNTGSLRLDGNSAYVEVAYDAALNDLDEVTIEAWVKRTADRCETLVGNGRQNSYWVGFCNDTLRFYHGSGTYVDGTNPVPQGQWTHVAVTYDGTTRRYYINGELDHETTGNAGPIESSNQQSLLIGADQEGCSLQAPCFYFEGLVDEVRIWNVVRSQDQIQDTLYQMIDGSQSGLLAVWHLDGDATDAAGNHDGALRGQATFSKETFPATPPPVSDEQVQALRALESESQRDLHVRFDDNGVPRFVAGEVPVPDDVPDDPVARALDFLDRYRTLYRLDDPHAQLYLSRLTEDDSGGEHVFFGQYHDDTPIFGAELAVHIVKSPNGSYAVRATNGNYAPELPVLPEPSIDTETAAATAVNDVASANATAIGKPRLMYFSPRIVDTGSPSTAQAVTPSRIQLVWRIVVRGERRDGVPTDWFYFIDAHDGTVVLRIDQLRNHGADKNFRIKTAKNANDWNNCSDPSTSETWFDEAGSLDDYPAGGDTDGQNAYDYVHDAYDLFFDSFHRHGWNDRDGRIETFVHVTMPNGPNAYYSPGCKQTRFDSNMATRDIVVHEHTHGVVDQTAQFIYQNQSGALDEHYSDVFAAMVDTANWTIGDGSATGTFRNLSDPPSMGAPWGTLTFTHPDQMSNLWTTSQLRVENINAPGGDNDGVCETGEPCMLLDNGGVHINNGIPNKVAYLITEGGTHNGITVDGIGREKAAWLYYDVLRDNLTRNATFGGQRNATVSQVRFYTFWGAIYGDVRDDFTAADVCSVINAFASAGLGSPDRDCDGTADPTDRDDDGDRVPDGEDNCRTVPNPRQSDTDGDGTGDACDTDIDGDGRANEEDNCRFTPNPGQMDSTANGLGDACDDQADSDGVPYAGDNCPSAYNPDQTDTDDDGDGDACDSDDDDDGVGDSEDNCRTSHNPDQADRDGDGVGDACDLCPDTHDPTNVDTDGDGAGDVCDADDDDDEITDATDNCELVVNPHQFDIDRNGQGLLCDEAEAALLSGTQTGLLDGLIRFRDPAESVQLPINPCLADGCPDYLPENYRTWVDVAMPVEVQTRIVDDRGFEVGSRRPGNANAMVFAPEADTFYRVAGIPDPLLQGRARSQQSEQNHVYRGTSYFLEITPSDEVQAGTDYEVAIDVDSREVTPQSIYLPAIVR